MTEVRTPEVQTTEDQPQEPPRSSTSNATTYWIGNPGKYFVKGFMNDPVNNYVVYLFTSDKNLFSYLGFISNLEVAI